MKFDVCDVCYAERRHKLVAGESITMHLGDERGQLDVCPTHRDELDTILMDFVSAGRVPISDDIHRCPECDFTTESKGSLRKHKARHAAARARASAQLNNYARQQEQLAETG